MTTVMRVLIVDDERMTVELAARALRSVCSVDTALNMADARIFLRERGPYAMVLADLRLPDGSGLDLLMEVAGTATRPTHLVLMTGTILSADEEQRIREAGIALLGKPFARPHLLALLPSSHPHHG